MILAFALGVALTWPERRRQVQRPGGRARAVSVSRGAVSVLRGGASRFGVYVMADLLRRLAIAILAGVVVVIYAAGVATGAMVF